MESNQTVESQNQASMPNQIQNQSQTKIQSQTEYQIKYQSENESKIKNQTEDKMDLVNPEPSTNENNISEIISKNNIQAEYIFNKNFFIERSFHSSFDGFYDEEDFFHTPEGSFFNQNREYYNRFGYDKYGGRYNNMGVYLPGEGWNSDFQCYEEDLDEDFLKQQVDQIECVFEDQIHIDNNPYNISIDSDELLEEDENEKFSAENQQIDFLKVKDVMEAELKQQAQSAQKNGVLNVESNLAPLNANEANNNVINNSHQGSTEINSSAVINATVSENILNSQAKEIIKSVNASASKIVNNQLIGNASHVKASTLKGDTSNINGNDIGNIDIDNSNNNNFSFNANDNNNNSNSQLKLNNININHENNLAGHTENVVIHSSQHVKSGNIKAENAVNIGATPHKVNHTHEPTPFKASVSEVNQDNDI